MLRARGCLERAAAARGGTFAGLLADGAPAALGVPCSLDLAEVPRLSLLRRVRTQAPDSCTSRFANCDGAVLHQIAGIQSCNAAVLPHWNAGNAFLLMPCALAIQLHGNIQPAWRCLTASPGQRKVEYPNAPLTRV